MEQKARGLLDRQKLENEKESEASRKLLLELQAVAAAVESSGQAKAEAQAHAEKLLIEGQSAIECESEFLIVTVYIQHLFFTMFLLKLQFHIAHIAPDAW